MGCWLCYQTLVITLTALVEIRARWVFAHSVPYLHISAVPVPSLKHCIAMTNTSKAGFGFSSGISRMVKGLWYMTYSFLESSELLLSAKAFKLLKSEKYCNFFKISTASVSNRECKGCTPHQPPPARGTWVGDQLLPDLSILLIKTPLEIRPCRYSKSLEI